MIIGHRPEPARSVAVVVLLGILLMVGIAGCGSDEGTAAASPERGTVTMTDQAGREVVVPDPIETVWCASPMGTNLMYMLAPELMVGWNITPTALEKKYIPDKYRTVTGLGGWYGKNTTGNVEEIIKRAPDVVFSLGDLDEAAISEAERIQGLLNIPVIMVDGDLVASGDALRYIGGLLGVEDRAKELADYCDEIIEEAKEITAGLSEADKVRVYYAEGVEGLNTDPEGSMHTEVLELAGGANVAQVALQSGYGMAPVSLEQVLVWDPHVILVASDPAEESNVYEQITTESQWKTITAVKNGEVYQIPRGPFDWFDRPPSISRILGVRWLGNLLYPDMYEYDIKKEVQEFYELFYHMELTDAQFQELTARAVRADR
ncbi:MAG: ABC transporter substrate-binding protein [Thermoleophilia bacterium]|nr:ABC transporter substrate-binding protein [Thermoleophilia bacterium]